MRTITAQATAMATAIRDACPEVDAVDLNSFLPLVDSRRVALVGTPTGGGSTLRPTNLQGTEWEAVHRVRLQLWVKVDTGAPAADVERAREVGHRALMALAAADGTGYSLQFDGTPLVAEAGPDVLEVAGVPYLLVTLTVTVWEAGAV